MTAHTADASIINELSTAHAPAAASERGPTLLAEVELDRVAAAGSKAGGTTDGRGLLGNSREP